MAPCREALSSHFRSRPAGEFAERVAVGAEDGQDALLGEKEFLFGEDFQGVVEAQTLRFGPVVIAGGRAFRRVGRSGLCCVLGACRVFFSRMKQCHCRPEESGGRRKSKK